jgi:tetratricopeptide (TPR) repeat protein
MAMCEIDLGICESELGLLESPEDHYEEALRMAASFEPYPRSLLETDLSILKAELLWKTGRFRESDEVYSWTIICAQESGQPYEMVSCYARYAMSLALRGMDEVARSLFQEAMEMGTSLGCERKVQALAQRVGISI